MKTITLIAEKDKLKEDVESETQVFSHSGILQKH